MDFSLSKPKRKKKFTLTDRKNILFIALVSFIPLLQFLVFYVYVNINSVIMAFQTYELDEAIGKGRYVFYGFNNFIRAYKELTEGTLMLTALKNSLIYFVISLVIGKTTSIIFSFYIYKRKPLYKVFKIMLFLPSILSSIVMILIYSYFVDFAMPHFISKIFGKTIEGLASNPKTMFGTVMFFCIWSGYGGSVLMYVGAMSNISDSIIDASKIDGCTGLQEFIHITLPMIYPTLSTLLIASFAGFFTADMGLFSFYAENAEKEIYTVGYYLFRQTKVATIAQYPYLACLGMIYTIVTVPFVYLTRYLFNKFDPFK